MVFKGKSTTRSWATLPPEVIRLITTHYLLAISATAVLPTVWQQRDHWPGRMAFTVVRDAEAIIRLMRVSPAWCAAIEYHLFWQQASAVLDASDHALPLARVHRLSPFRHFRQHLYQRSCIPCRVNYPTTNNGIMGARRFIYTYTFGPIPCCREHRKDRVCGICLRDAMTDENCVLENEECEYWQSVEATCRDCRMDGLWKVCCEGQVQAGSRLTMEAEAVGGRGLAPNDWEARQAVDAFVEMGEGNIRDVLNLCVDKLWLKKHTKIGEMMRLAVATSRMQSRMAENANEAGIVGGVMGEYEDEEELSEVEEEEDPELMSITEDTQGVRDLAINDWVRTRILDGYWYSPADQWYLIQGQGNISAQWLPPLPDYPHFPYVSAAHPVPWNLTQSGADRRHPDPGTVHTLPPPSLSLCSATYEAFRRQFRAILLPAMTNIVRKAVMECAVDGTDASVRVARMSIEDVTQALREGSSWYNGVDWVDRRRRREVKKEDVDDSSSSDRSGSGTTSPVLSTSTLQTTPSPPPTADIKIKPSTSTSSMPPPPSSPIMALPIAISPVLEPPTQIPSIPFIPESFSEMPAYTMETFKQIWRDACAPLFQCRCKICERAVLKANIQAGNIVPSQHYPQTQEQEQLRQILLPPVEVRIDLVSDSEEDPTVVSPDARSEFENEQGHPQSAAMSRKRSCEAAEIINADGFDPEEALQIEERNKRSKTPPEKRQKLGKHEIEAERRSSTAPPLSESLSPSDTVKVAPLMTEWEELGGLDDDGLYVMDEAPLLDDGV